MTENENKYWAFLSFSHQDNCEQRPDSQTADHRCWGDWLQHVLMSFSIPAEFVGQINGRGESIPERIHPIFREEEEQREDAALSAETRQALEQSICLVVICSPRSARSQTMNEAVRYFKQLGRGKCILPLVVAGEPNASDGNKSGRSPDEECFVPALRHPVQPDGTLDTTRRAGKSIFVDARHGAEKREILAHDHRHAEADLEMAKIHLIALLLGVGFNGLWWREQQRHFFDLIEAQHQAREALNQVEAAQRQIREAQTQALETQNLPRDIQSQIQAAQTQALEAQSQAREAQKQLQEFQTKVRDTQTQLEEARSRARAAESQILEAQHLTRETQSQLEATRNQASEAERKILEIQARTQVMPDQNQDAQNQILKAQSNPQETQLEEIREQAQAAQNKFLEAQSQVQALQEQARSAQSQLEEARHQVHEAQRKVQEARNEAREAQAKALETQNHTQLAQSQKANSQSRDARRLTKIFAILAALALLTAGVTARVAWRQRQVASQALAKATAAETGNFDPASGDMKPIRSVLQTLAGTEPDDNRRRSLDQLAAGIPPAEIPEALKASVVIANDEQRSHFQKWLLIRLGWLNPVSAMTSASTIEGIIVNDEGLSDSVGYFQLAVLDNWMKTDLTKAVSWVCQVSDTCFRQRALEKIIGWVKSQPDSEAKSKALETGIAELAPTDIAASLALADSLPEGDRRNTLIFQLWMKADPFATSEWINSLNLPREIMEPRKIQLPGTEFLPTSQSGILMSFPVEDGISSNSTNGPIQTNPRE